MRLIPNIDGVEVRPSRPGDAAPQQKTLTLLLECQHCGGGLPLHGPTRKTRCSLCLEDNLVPTEKLLQVLQWVSMDAGQTDSIKYTDSGHPCPGCGERIDVRAIARDSEFADPCGHCGAAIVAQPPPDWLKTQLPALVMLFGAELDEEATAGSAVEPEQQKPVVLTCPNCGGTLKITGDRARSTACEFCQADVYLPDDLWRKLHPAKKVKPWTIVHQGFLWTTEEINSEEKRIEAALQEKKRLQAEGKRLAEQRQIEAQQKRQRRRRSAVIVAIIAVGVAAIGYFAFL